MRIIAIGISSPYSKLFYCFQHVAFHLQAGIFSTFEKATNICNATHKAPTNKKMLFTNESDKIFDLKSLPLVTRTPKIF